MGPISRRIGYQGETNINSVEVHPQLSNNRHPVAGAHWCVLVQWPRACRVCDCHLDSRMPEKLLE